MSLSRKFVFTLRKRGVVSIGTDQKPRPHLTLLWRHALSPKMDLPDKPGAYILADMVPGTDGKRAVYVGRSDEALLGQRIHQHRMAPLTGISEWGAAVCYTGDNRYNPLRPEESAAMEYLLYADLTSRSGVSLANKRTPREPSLPHTRWEILKSHSQLVLSLLETVGVVLEKAPSREKPEPSPSEPKTKYYGVSLSDLVNDGLLQVGDILKSTPKASRQQAEAEIADARGQIRLLRHGRDSQGRWLRHVPPSEPTHSSPSGAGEVVIKAGGGGGATNGWTFWIETSSGKTLAELRDEYIRRRR